MKFLLMCGLLAGTLQASTNDYEALRRRVLTAKEWIAQITIFDKQDCEQLPENNRYLRYFEKQIENEIKFSQQNVDVQNRTAYLAWWLHRYKDHHAQCAYAALILSNIATLEEIPQIHRDAVKQLLNNQDSLSNSPSTTLHS